MIYVFVGAALALVFIAALAAAVALGWFLRGRWASHRKRTLSRELGEQVELERQQDEAAFQALMHYNVAMAYGEEDKE